VVSVRRPTRRDDWEGQLRDHLLLQLSGVELQAHARLCLRNEASEYDGAFACHFYEGNYAALAGYSHLGIRPHLHNRTLEQVYNVEQEVNVFNERLHNYISDNKVYINFELEE